MGSGIPLHNDFLDIAHYKIKMAIVESIGLIRNRHGSAPLEVQRFLTKILRFNDNEKNPVSNHGIHLKYKLTYG